MPHPVYSLADCKFTINGKENYFVPFCDSLHGILSGYLLGDWLLEQSKKKLPTLLYSNNFAYPISIFQKTVFN